MSDIPFENSVRWALSNCAKKSYMWEWAVRQGRLDVVKWLHENRNEGCTTDAMDHAASNGYLDVVKSLHENRKEGCTEWAMNWAAENGHFGVVHWLRENNCRNCVNWSINKEVVV